MPDSGAAEEARAPKVILSYDPRRGPAPGEVEDGDEPNILDWQARFGRRSPLSRKIITFNLLALGVLLTGVLYLNQYQGGLVEIRARTLATEAQLVASIVADGLGGEGLTAQPDATVSAMLGEVRALAPNRVLLFTPEGEMVNVPEPGGPVQVVRLTRTGSGDNPPSAFIAIMGELWDRMSRLFATRRAGDLSLLTGDFARPLVADALESGRPAQIIGPTTGGDQVIAVAVPVRDASQADPLGAVVLSTMPGDVDEIIRSEREKILQVFALASISSIVLSLVLASTIVRPLRDLSEAAHEGGTRNARQLNPQRINIPDMTGRPDEIGYLSAAMRLMTEALFDRIEANESFAADVAHEIKNPLTSLRSAVETMPYAKTDESREKLLAVIKNDVDRLDRLVTDISNASRLDSELVRDQMEPFDLHALLTNLIAFNEEQAAKPGARLKALFPDQPLTILGLEGRLAQVFVNLITNAISFASEGDVIRVNTVPRGKMVRVTVEDDGPGIPDDNLADVFERFYSERPVKEEFGNHSGLGLAISKQIIQAHGGKIWAENIRPEGAGLEIPPQGARFVVELPV